MKKYVSLAAIVCLSSLIVGCSDNESANQVTIELEGNITTGYSWEYEFTRPGIIVEVANDYIENNIYKSAIGAGGVFTFTFSGLAPGETEIVFNYVRPWENDALPERTVVYRAVVDEANVLVISQK